ncbi:hypothetical protein PHLCEN_2v4751 [Hermanssonia centrifuga]|uniref:Uncharacterized protein n=1 Tax=Hermanssonia centrifuga TaxID=98765 RepID=A0A2R6PK05_9APHY|nr:hypothetical protein PHLCEN_2v4751 [Hermanssonia centrifuga]
MTRRPDSPHHDISRAKVTYSSQASTTAQAPPAYIPGASSKDNQAVLQAITRDIFKVMKRLQPTIINAVNRHVVHQLKEKLDPRKMIQLPIGFDAAATTEIHEISSYIVNKVQDLTAEEILQILRFVSGKLAAQSGPSSTSQPIAPSSTDSPSSLPSTSPPDAIPLVASTDRPLPSIADGVGQKPPPNQTSITQPSPTGFPPEQVFQGQSQGGGSMAGSWVTDTHSSWKGESSPKDQYSTADIYSEAHLDLQGQPSENQRFTSNAEVSVSLPPLSNGYHSPHRFQEFTPYRIPPVYAPLPPQPITQTKTERRQNDGVAAPLRESEESHTPVTPDMRMHVGLNKSTIARDILRSLGRPSSSSGSGRSSPVPASLQLKRKAGADSDDLSHKRLKQESMVDSEAAESRSTEGEPGDNEVLKAASEDLEEIKTYGALEMEQQQAEDEQMDRLRGVFDSVEQLQIQFAQTPAGDGVHSHTETMSFSQGESSSLPSDVPESIDMKDDAPFRHPPPPVPDVLPIPVDDVERLNVLSASSPPPSPPALMTADVVGSQIPEPLPPTELLNDSTNHASTSQVESSKVERVAGSAAREPLFLPSPPASTSDREELIDEDIDMDSFIPSGLLGSRIPSPKKDKGKQRAIEEDFEVNEPQPIKERWRKRNRVVESDSDVEAEEILDSKEGRIPRRRVYVLVPPLPRAARRLNEKLRRTEAQRRVATHKVDQRRANQQEAAQRALAQQIVAAHTNDNANDVPASPSVVEAMDQQKRKEGVTRSQHLHQACNKSYETPVELARHHAGHQGEQLKPIAGAEPLRSTSSIPPLPEFLPSYMSVPRRVTKHRMSHDIHIWLGAKASNINICWFDINAAVPSRSTRHLADVLNNVEREARENGFGPTKAVLAFSGDEYDSWISYSDNLGPKYCDDVFSTAVTQMVGKGLILGAPQPSASTTGQSGGSEEATQTQGIPIIEADGVNDVPQCDIQDVQSLDTSFDALEIQSVIGSEDLTEIAKRLVDGPSVDNPLQQEMSAHQEMPSTTNSNLEALPAVHEEQLLAPTGEQPELLPVSKSGAATEALGPTAQPEWTVLADEDTVDSSL